MFWASTKRLCRRPLQIVRRESSWRRDKRYKAHPRRFRGGFNYSPYIDTSAGGAPPKSEQGSTDRHQGRLRKKPEGRPFPTKHIADLFQRRRTAGPLLHDLLFECCRFTSIGKTQPTLPSSLSSRAAEPHLERAGDGGRAGLNSAPLPLRKLRVFAWRS